MKYRSENSVWIPDFIPEHNFGIVLSPTKQTESNRRTQVPGWGTESYCRPQISGGGAEFYRRPEVLG